VKFLIDNNLPPSWAPALTALSQRDANHTVHHIRDKFSADIADTDWLAHLAAEGGWAILSGDLRITRNQHERDAWLSSGMVAFFTSRSWSKLPYWEKTWRIVRWWPNILQQANLVTAPAGFD
jgi:hypothetical protein